MKVLSVEGMTTLQYDLLCVIGGWLYLRCHFDPVRRENEARIVAPANVLNTTINLSVMIHAQRP
jgi:hypothetical protein